MRALSPLLDNLLLEEPADHATQTNLHGACFAGKGSIIKGHDRAQAKTTGTDTPCAAARDCAPPALTSRPLNEEVSEVLAERDALYREAAHHVVDASASPEDVVIQIITALRLACAS